MQPRTPECGIVNQLGTDEYNTECFFRRKINLWLRQVKALWPECPRHIPTDENCLQIPPSNGMSSIRPPSATLATLTPTVTTKTAPYGPQTMSPILSAADPGRFIDL